MKLETIVLGQYGTNCYILYDETTKEGIITDPGYTPDWVLECLKKRGVHLQAILLTHGHFDHVGGVRTIHEATGCKVYLCKRDLAMPEYLTAGPLCYTDLYDDGDELDFGPLHFRVLATPGHTPGSVCLLCGDLLFSGDTLFAGNCGRTDGPGGSWKDVCNSLRRLYELEGDYQVLPGHGNATTLQKERLGNAFMLEAIRR